MKDTAILAENAKASSKPHMKFFHRELAEDIGGYLTCIDEKKRIHPQLEIVPSHDRIPVFQGTHDHIFISESTSAEASEVIATASLTEVELVEIDLSEGGEDLAGGTAIVSDMILLGFDQDRLVYVETMGLFPEGGGL